MGVAIGGTSCRCWGTSCRTRRARGRVVRKRNFQDLSCWDQMKQIWREKSGLKKVGRSLRIIRLLITSISRYDHFRVAHPATPGKRKMDPRSICEVFNTTLNMDMIPDDIILPKAERIQDIYRRFLMVSMGIGEQSLHQLPLDYNDPEHTESHSRGIPINLLYATMSSFVADFCSEKDLMFTMCDLVNPDPRRTRRFFVIFADYLRWHSLSNEAFDSVALQYEDQRKELESVQADLAHEERRKVDLRNQEDVRMRRENALLSELGQRTNQFKQLHQANEECEARRNMYLSQIEEEQRIKLDLLNERESLLAQLDHLSKGIIQSPKRVLRELDQQREELVNLREVCDKQRQTNSDHQCQLELAGTVEKMIERLAEEIKNLDGQKVEMDSSCMEKANCESKLADAARKLNHVQSLVKRAEQDILHCEESKKNDEELHSERMTQLQEHIAELEGEVITLRESTKDAPGEVKAIHREIATLKGECAEKVRDTKAHVDELMDLYKSFMRDFKNERVLQEQMVGTVRDTLANFESKLTGDGDFTMDLTMNNTLSSTML